jgi:hypothetical protein
LIADRWILTSARCVLIPGWVNFNKHLQFNSFNLIFLLSIKVKHWGIWRFTSGRTTSQRHTKPIGEFTTGTKPTSIRNGIPAHRLETLP